MKSEPASKLSKRKQLKMSNSFVEASQDGTPTELRLIRFGMLDLTSEEIGFSPENPIVLKVKDFVKFFGLSEHTAYRDLMTATERLYERSYIEKKVDGSELKKTRYLTSVLYKLHAGEIHLAFNPDMKKHVLGLIRNFTIIKNVSILGSFRSAYSMRLYELLARFSSTGVFITTRDDLRFSLNISKELATRDFNKKIEEAVSEINIHAEIFVDVIALKEGRKITGYKFCFVLKEDVAAKAIKKEVLTPAQFLSYEMYCLRYKLEGEPLEAAMTRLELNYKQDIQAGRDCVKIKT